MPLIYPSANALSIRQRLWCLCYFFVVFGLYGLTNAYTLLLAKTIDIPHLVLAVDNIIAFIPSFILLYSASLWLLIASFFMVADTTGLYKLTHRLLLATAIGCVCFYHLPLRFYFELPSHGQDFNSLGINWYWAFQLLHDIDKPYNQLPSLHVAYAWILLGCLWQPRAFFSRYIGLYRGLLSLLCVGIAISTLLIWQHHVLDVIGGSVLAVSVIFLEQYVSQRLPLASVKLVIRYAVLAIAGYLVIFMLPLLWLSWYGNPRTEDWLGNWQVVLQLIGGYWLVSWLILSYLYFRSDSKLTSTIFAKNAIGNLSVWAYVWQLPILISYQLLWRMLLMTGWLTASHRFNPIPISMPRVGSSYRHIDIVATARCDNNSLDSAVLQRYQQIIWLDVASEMSSSFRWLTSLMPLTLNKNIDYMYFALLDLQPFGSVLPQQLHDCLAKIDYYLHRTACDQSTLIVCQCTMGWSRSVAMVACCVAYFGKFSIAQICQLLNDNYPYHHVSADYLSEAVLINLQQKSSQLS